MVGDIALYTVSLTLSPSPHLRSSSFVFMSEEEEEGVRERVWAISSFQPFSFSRYLSSRLSLPKYHLVFCYVFFPYLLPFPLSLLSHGKRKKDRKRSGDDIW